MFDSNSDFRVYMTYMLWPLEIVWQTRFTVDHISSLLFILVSDVFSAGNYFQVRSA